MPIMVTTRTGNTVDWVRVRDDFPILASLGSREQRLAFLDSAASSQKPERVIAAVDRYYRETNANIHRGVYDLSERATAQYEAARHMVADFINAASPREIVFVRNTTEAINLVAQTWGRRHISAGDLILVTTMDHHSNLVPWQLLAEEKDARLEAVRITDEGVLDLEHLDELLAQGPRLVAFPHVSNSLGTINPAAEIIRKAHDAGAIVVVDGAQSVPHMPVDVQALDADFLAFSGHKMLGPMGSGVLYGKLSLLEGMPPFMGGGGMIRKVSLTRSTWADVPARFEAGTPSVGDAIGLGVAVEYLQGIGMDTVREHERELTAQALDRLREVPGIRLLGPEDLDDRAGVLSFTLGDIHPHDVAAILNEENVAVRAGHHCCQPLMDRLGVVATTRASFYVYNVDEDVDRLVSGLHRAQAIFAS
ncbi:MAG: SufS family cysteine desulfurase [Chloroflexi bacterium]|nr:SufS family cysteine desulfurase [Chloroflexota bacterium]